MIDPELRDDGPAVTPRTLRQFAALTIVILGGLAAWHGFTGVLRRADLLFIVIAAIVGGVGLIYPEAIRPLYSGLMKVTTPIGHVMSSIVLAVLFYGIFTPVGVLLRLFGRDPLSVRRPERRSHWVPKTTPVDVSDYTRQS